MEKRRYKYDLGSNSNSSIMSPFESNKPQEGLHSKAKEKINLKQILLSLTVLSCLGAWIGLSVLSSNLFLDKALICSAIISALLFFKLANQKKRT